MFIDDMKARCSELRHGVGYDAHNISSRLSSQKKAVSKSHRKPHCAAKQSCKPELRGVSNFCKVFTRKNNTGLKSYWQKSQSCVQNVTPAPILTANVFSSYPAREITSSRGNIKVHFFLQHVPLNVLCECRIEERGLSFHKMSPVVSHSVRGERVGQKKRQPWIVRFMSGVWGHVLPV